MAEHDERDLTTAEFKGYVTAKLEDIIKKLDRLDECVDKMKLKVAAVGATISLIVTVLVIIVKELLAK